MWFMREGTELSTSFASPRQLEDLESASCAGDEYEDLAPILILVKTESLGLWAIYLLAIFETRKA